MVSKASDDLPEPDSPVNTTSWSRGIVRSTFLRLCSRAPRIAITRACPCASAARSKRSSILAIWSFELPSFARRRPVGNGLCSALPPQNHGTNRSRIKPRTNEEQDASSSSRPGAAWRLSGRGRRGILGLSGGGSGHDACRLASRRFGRACRRVLRARLCRLRSGAGVQRRQAGEMRRRSVHGREDARRERAPVRRG